MTMKLVLVGCAVVPSLRRETFAFVFERKQGRQQSAALLALCMLLSCAIRAHSSFVVVARKYPSTTTVSRGSAARWIAPASATTAASSSSSSSGASSCLQAAQYVNGDTSNRDNANDNKKNSQGGERPSEGRSPQTGWNHNQPSDKSKFWQGGSEKYPPSSSSSNKARDSPLRTGWLHNTAPSRAEGGEAQPQSTASSAPTSSPSLARQRLNQAMRDQFRKDLNHRILTATFHSTGSAVAVVTEHVIQVPLKHRTIPSLQSSSTSSAGAGASGPNSVDVYFSVVEKLSKETQWLRELQDDAISDPQRRAQLYVEKAGLQSADEMCLFLQGGPGFGAPVPIVGLGLGKDASWGSAALDSCGFTRLVLLDQRGTGRSTPITKQWIELNYPDLFLLDDSISSTLEEGQANDPEKASRVKAAVDQVTDYLSCFRCDSIVQDAELVRQALLLEPDAAAASSDPTQSPRPPRPWGGALGQSFGGFCLLNYLSSVNHPPEIALFTGGIPPMLTPLLDVYHKLWDRVKERSLRYYDMYPDDVQVVKTIVRRLLEKPPKLPSGGKLTARRFLQLGLRLGSAPPSFAAIHSMLSGAFVPGTDQFSRPFLKGIEVEQSFDDHPIYYWLHEPSCYADGNFNRATNWAAHRAYQQRLAEEGGDQWDYAQTCLESDARPVLWFGEHIFPWMAEDYGELSGVGLTAVSEALAQKSDWGPLFNGDKILDALASKRSRAAAAVYYEDMYVEFDACVKVAARGGPLEKCKLYITNEYQHSGLRDDGSNLFSKLYGMATGTIRTPS